MTTIGQMLEQSQKTLTQAGISDARLDARLLAAFALKRTPEQIFGYPEVELKADQLSQIRALIARRAEREPLALIIGRKEFWSLRFGVSPATLIPRPDSETLIEAVIETFRQKDAAFKILDLGTGSGCLLLSLLHEYKNASGVGTDISDPALLVARANAQNLGLGGRAEFVRADWRKGAPNSGKFDIIISNPPYVPLGDKKSLQREVSQYEPHSALFGGADGLSEYPLIIDLLGGLLNDRGVVFFEVGIGQAHSVAHMLAQTGMHNTRIYPDIAGIERCVAASAFAA